MAAKHSEAEDTTMEAPPPADGDADISFAEREDEDDDAVSSLDHSDLFAAVEESVISCRPLVNFFYHPTDNDDTTTAKLTTRQRRDVICNIVKSPKFNKTRARRLFSGLTPLLRKVVDEESYCPDEDDNGDIIVDAHAASTLSVMYLRVCAFLVDAYLDGLLKRQRKGTNNNNNRRVEIIDEVFEVAEMLHDLLFPLQNCGKEGMATQSAIFCMCENWWHGNFDDKELFVTQLIPLLLVKSLADTIHRKTEGNPFFILMFLRSLYDEKLLQFNFGVMKWTWDEDAVNSKIVTENVASVLVNKMNRLQEETQRMLMVASCLGATFRLSAVMMVMENISRVEMRDSMRASMISVSGTAATMGSSSASLLSSDLSNAYTDQDGSDSSYASSIEEFEGEGLCEVDNEECRFMHDQIQSAAFELISPEQRDSFRGRIGSILLLSLPPEELEASLFEVVGLLNCAASNVTDGERDELARMNLKAGIKASENAAFDTAKVYFKTGRDALGSRGWEGDYRTMLDLCSHGANACYLTGDFDSMNALIDEVLSKDIDTKEKYRVSEIKVRSLYSIGKHNESVNAALDFRRQLGLPTPKKKPASKFIIIREFIRVKRLLKNKTAEDIANLPELDNERYKMGQRMNEHLAACIYRVEPTMVPLILFQLVTTSLKHGLNPSSSPAFAGLGMLLCGPFGKPHEGREMAKAAELILEKPGMRSGAIRTVFITQACCYHWTSPLQDAIAPLLEGYQIGLEIGDNESACYCLSFRSYHLFFTGRALDSIQKELEATIPVLTQLKQDESKLTIIALLAAVKKLRGFDAEAGDKILDSILATAASNENFTMSAAVNLTKLEVFVFYQKWKEAIDLVRKAGNVRLFLSCFFSSVRYTFLEALTYLKAAQLASGWKKRQMKKCALQTIHLIRGWAKNGNVNVVHYLFILEAELAVLNGKNKKAKESFNSAITTSSRNGFLHDRALAHELASAHFKAQGDEYWGNYHVECSRICYQEWGCSGKVEQLM